MFSCIVFVACQYKADIALMVDTSVDTTSAIEQETWSSMLGIVGDLVESIDISSNKNKIALAGFDKVVKVKVALNALQTRTHLLQKAFSLDRSQGMLDVKEAIRAMRETLFSTGNRPSVPDIGVILMDETPDMALLDQAKLARSEGVKLLAIGFGHKASKTLMEQISFNNNMAFNIKQEDKVSSILHLILKAIKESSRQDCYFAPGTNLITFQNMNISKMSTT